MLQLVDRYRHASCMQYLIYKGRAGEIVGCWTYLPEIYGVERSGYARKSTLQFVVPNIRSAP